MNASKLIVKWEFRQLFPKRLSFSQQVLATDTSIVVDEFPSDSCR